MSWLQLELETGKAEAEILSGLLEQLGAVSVSLSASSDDPVFDHLDQQQRQYWDKTRVSALLHPDTDLDILLVCLRDRIGADRIFSHHIDRVHDKDWIGEFKAQHEPVLFADRIWIVPSWCDRPDSDKPGLVLDPGLAFGTGAHPTTAMCVSWLASHDLADKVVIDYGCGSGILAMVAARLGAREVYAVDIDAQAVQAASENAKQNALEDKIHIGLPDTMKLPCADILVANILANPLKELAPDLAELTQSGGDIVLSGLLHIQADECLASYSGYFNMDTPEFDSEWACLHGVRH